MSADLVLACRCGAVRGLVRDAGPEGGDHVVCHCTDCRAFAQLFDASEHVLDDHGGTALYQTRCARLELGAGRDRLGCLHLTEKPTLRWFARCCRTPMFNSWRNGRMPYVTALVCIFATNRPREVLGEPLGHLFLSEATGDPRGLTPMSMSAMARRFLPRMAKDMLSGDRRRSALFDARTLDPIATPERLQGARDAG